MTLDTSSRMFEFLKYLRRITSMSLAWVSLNYLKFLANIPKIDLYTDSSTILQSGTSSFSSMALSAFSILIVMSPFYLCFTSIIPYFITPCNSISFSKALSLVGILFCTSYNPIWLLKKPVSFQPGIFLALPNSYVLKLVDL